MICTPKVKHFWGAYQFQAYVHKTHGCKEHIHVPFKYTMDFQDCFTDFLYAPGGIP